MVIILLFAAIATAIENEQEPRKAFTVNLQQQRLIHFISKQGHQLKFHSILPLKAKNFWLLVGFSHLFLTCGTTALL